MNEPTIAAITDRISAPIPGEPDAISEALIDARNDVRMLLEENATLRGHIDMARMTPCQCEWNDKPWHDGLVGIEGTGHFWAADLVANLVRGIDGDEGPLSGPPINDFERFVTEHNWKDPITMSRLAADLQYINEQGRS